MTFLHTPATVLGQFIVTGGFGSWPPGTSWPVTINALPADEQDNRIALFDYPNGTFGRNLRTKETYIYPAVQLRTRSKSHDDAYTKLLNIWNRLQEIVPAEQEEVVLTSPTFTAYLQSVQMRSPISPLPGVEEKNKRWNFVLSVQLTFGEA